MWKRLLIVLALSLTFAVIVQAQETFGESDAIDTAVQSEIFSGGLEQNPGWTAAAYDTGNAYGIWRVQFWSADGEDLGWADVSPARGRIYSWEAHFGATDAQKNAAEPILRNFIAKQPDVIDLLEDPSQYDVYVDYDGWNRWWGVYVEVGADSLWMAVQFAGKSPDSLDDPQLLGLYFANVLSYDEWQQSQKAIAIATAFQNAEIAKAVSKVDSWTTSVEHNDENLWTVNFMNGDEVLARVQVDLATNEVVDYSVNG